MIRPFQFWVRFWARVDYRAGRGDGGVRVARQRGHIMSGSGWIRMRCMRLGAGCGGVIVGVRQLRRRMMGGEYAKGNHYTNHFWFSVFILFNFYILYI